VLVDGSGNVTYAAETSLTEDPTLEPIDHPLVDAFFDGFNGQTYTRNDRPWQGW
jgi:hemimethylated DNA binding protein